MRKNKLREIKGKKIRCQYFNMFIFLEALVVSMVLPVMVINTLWGTSGTKLNHWSELFDVVFAVAVSMLPFAAASFLNRFLFGKVVCVLNENGLYYQTGDVVTFIRWENIAYIEYAIRLPSRKSRLEWCFAHVACANEDVVIQQAPYMLLSKARAYNANIQTKLEKSGMQTVVFVIVSTFLLSCFLGLWLVLS